MSRAWLIRRIASFKLLALCCGRGPLAAKGLPLSTFLALFLLPLYTHSQAAGGSPRAQKALRLRSIVLSVAVKAVVAFTITYMMLHEPPRALKHLGFGKSGAGRISKPICDASILLCKFVTCLQF